MTLKREVDNMPRPRTSEVHAYAFIKDNLKMLGWVVKNPVRSLDGQVYTQQECLEDARIAEKLGARHPENIVKLSESEFYVIEAKPQRDQISEALAQAQERYAERINESAYIKVKIISGVTGNDTDGYLVKSKFLQNSVFRPIIVNGRELTSLITPQIAKILLETNNPVILDVPVDERIFLSTAEKINSILHKGLINKNNRAKVMSALLLALVDETQPNVNASPSVLINDINSRANAVLQREGKPEFFPFIRLSLPSTPDNHLKFKIALIQTIQELNNLNIRSAMNSGTDVLGKFYEVFLKYGNGAKEIGIVLTPRHITKFAVDILDIRLNDIVFDPCCGTGGFLVAAFDKVKRNFEEEDTNLFKQHNIFGIDSDPDVVALAIVNMIFRGDGKNNIIEGNCFQKYLNLKRINEVNTAKYINRDSTQRIPPISRVLMNPPFALKTSDEKEYKFIEQALKQMHIGGLLFSVLPRSVLVKQAQYRQWREDLLESNNLLAIVNFPEDLFYPIGVQTCGIIIKKGKPHPREQNILWLRIKTDGLLKSKGKRLPSMRTTNELEEKTELVKNFILNPRMEVENIPEVQKACPIDFADRLLELLPEVYIDERTPTETELKNKVELTLRETMSFMIKDNRTNDFRENVLTQDFFRQRQIPSQDFTWAEIPITDLFVNPIKTGDYHVSGELDVGNIPLVSCSAENNGFEGKFDIPQNTTIKNAITIASDGQPLASYYHYYPFGAKDNVIIGIPTRDYKFTTLLFFTTQLNALRWRFSYGRKCYLNKIHKIKIFLPFRDGNIDEDYIEYLFNTSPSWNTLRKLFIDIIPPFTEKYL
jgi:SAM-dependent methyltransferase